MSIIFKASDVHQGHYVIVDGEFTGIVVNLYAYQTNDEYKECVDKQIKEYVDNETQ